MNWAIRLMNLRLTLACCAALLLGASSTASAAPMAIDFSLIPATTTISATGTASWIAACSPQISSRTT